MSPNSKLKAVGTGANQEMEVEAVSGSAGSASDGLAGGRPGVLKRGGGDPNRRSRSPPEGKGNVSNQTPPAWPAPPPGFLHEEGNSKLPSWTNPLKKSRKEGEPQEEPILSDIRDRINNLTIQNEERWNRIEFAISSF